MVERQKALTNTRQIPTFYGGRATARESPNRSDLTLNDVLSIGFHSASSRPRRQKVGAIVHHELLLKLEEYFSVVPLLPMCVSETLDALKPDVLIIHRDAFESGVWFGADRQMGSHLIAEISSAGTWAAHRKCRVILVDNGKPENASAGVLEEVSTDFFPNRYFRDKTTEGASRGLIFELAQAYSDTDPLGGW